jgi:hypothetical protein
VKHQWRVGKRRSDSEPGLPTIVLRRQVKADLAMVDESNPEHLPLSFGDLTDDTVVYKCAVAVTSLPGEILTVAQLYRDRADAEDPFDELKNHWGWGGFTWPAAVGQPSPRPGTGRRAAHRRHTTRSRHPSSGSQRPQYNGQRSFAAAA